MAHGKCDSDGDYSTDAYEIDELSDRAHDKSLGRVRWSGCTKG